MRADDVLIRSGLIVPLQSSSDHNVETNTEHEEHIHRPVAGIHCASLSSSFYLAWQRWTTALTIVY